MSLNLSLDKVKLKHHKTNLRKLSFTQVTYLHNKLLTNCYYVFPSMSEIRNSKIPSTRDIIDGRINSLSESLKRNPFEKNRKTGTVSSIPYAEIRNFD